MCKHSVKDNVSSNLHRRLRSHDEVTPAKNAKNDKAADVCKTGHRRNQEP